MTTIAALTDFVSALGSCTALWLFASHLVDVLARARGVDVDDADTPTESDRPTVPAAPVV